MYEVIRVFYKGDDDDEELVKARGMKAIKRKGLIDLLDIYHFSESERSKDILELITSNGGIIFIVHPFETFASELLAARAEDEANEPEPQKVQLELTLTAAQPEETREENP